MAQGDKVWSKGNFGYGRFQMTDPGQVIVLEGMANDEKMTRLGHLREIPKGSRFSKCGPCGAEFITDGYLNNHGRLRHSGAEGERLEALEESSQKLSDAVPLNLDKTAASVAAGLGTIDVASAPRRAGSRAGAHA